MKILITGGAGFIGSHLVDLLIEKNHQVIVVDNLKSGNNDNINPEAKFYQLDIRSNELEKVFSKERPEVVYHLAAQASVPPSINDPLYDQSVNIGGTINILEQMKKFNARKIIYSSSAAIYGEPINLPIKETHPIKPLSPYGLSKKIAEDYIQLYNRMYDIEYSILRYANIYGPRQRADAEGGVIAIFADKLLHNEPITINGDGRHTRDFVYVKDAAIANYLAISNGNKGIMNVSRGKAISLLELIGNFEQVIGKKVDVRYKEEREGDIVHSTLANEEIKRILNWEAKIELGVGLRNTLMK